jgi:hypothetical protein
MSKDKIRNKVQELAKKYGYYFINGFTSEDRICLDAKEASAFVERCIKLKSGMGK